MHRNGLRLEHHLADTVAVMAGDGEGFVDAVEFPCVGEQRGKPIGVGLEQVQSLMVAWFDRRTLKMVSSLRRIEDPSRETMGVE